MTIMYTRRAEGGGVTGKKRSDFYRSTAGVTKNCSDCSGAEAVTKC